MIRMFLGLMLTLLYFVPVAHAQSGDEMVEVTAGKPLELRADRAYILFRTNSVGVAPVFLRIPTDAEMKEFDAAKRAAFAKAEPNLVKKRNDLIAARDAAAKAGATFDKTIPPAPSVDDFNFVYDKIRNVQTVKMGRALEKTGDGRTLLVEVRPGNYVVYGVGFGDVFHTCLCLGSVSFSAQPGRIADLGTILIASASEKSDIPQLADETGFGPSMIGHVVTWAVAIRPATPSTAPPAQLAGKPVAPVDYRATGKFVAGFSFSVNRLAPIPGVLGYDRGKVLDLATNKVAENQY